MQLRQVAIEKVTNAFDSWNEKFTSQIEILDHYTSVMESFANIVDIVGKKTLGITDEMMKNWTQFITMPKKTQITETGRL